MRKPNCRIRSIGVGLWAAIFGLVYSTCLSPLELLAAAGQQQLNCSQGQAQALGINVSNLSWSALLSNNVVPALAQSGVGWTRINIYWAYTESAPGQFNWTDIDAGLARLQASQINVLVTINGPVPCWAVGNGGAGCTQPQWTTPDTGAWSAFVQAVVARYGDRIHNWEIWNEPDLFMYLNISDPTQRLIAYRDDILIPAANIIHQVDPSAKVIGPVFAAIPSGHTGIGPDLAQAFSLVMQGTGASVVDVVSFHSYNPDDPNAKALAFRSAMETAGMSSKPLWITEMGFTPETSDGRFTNYSDYQQSRYLESWINNVLSQGNAEEVFWFALTDGFSVSGAHVGHYGLLDNTLSEPNMRPRLAFKRLHDMIQASCSP